MAIPSVTPVATWDKTANTMGRSVDSVLWPMLCAKSQLLDRIPRFSVDNTEFEWESANTVPRTFTADAHHTETGADAHATGQYIGIGGVSGAAQLLQVGAIIRNASRATPIGTHGVDELMQVIEGPETSTDEIKVTRNYGVPVGSTAATGSTAHVATDTYEILYSPKQEGSSPIANKYKDVSLVKNWTQIVDFYLTVTGSQLASKRLLPADNMQRQFEDRLVELKNDLESMFLYGQVASGGAAVDSFPADETSYVQTGSDSYIRTTRGVQNFVTVSGGNVDYTTKAVTEEAINSLMASIMTDGTDMSDPFILVAHPNQIRVIAAFGADKVRITQAETKWGRSLKTLETDLGVDIELVPCLNMSKSDLFIIDTKKVGIAEFRPFMKFEWGMDTSTPDGTDAYKQRYLGELGAKVVDGPYSHAAMSYLTWV